MSQHSARGKGWAAQRKRVLDRDGWQCMYCTIPLDDTNATVDHVEAISLSPEKEYRDDELVACCRPCNSRKQDKTLVRMNYRSQAWV